MKKTFHDILTEVSNQTSHKARWVLLRKYYSKPLFEMLAYTFNSNIKWKIPEDEPPFTSLKHDADVEYRLEQELRKMYLFVEGNTPQQKGIKQLKMETLYIQLLESLGPKDVAIVLGMRAGKLPYPNITKKLVQAAFPAGTTHW